MSKARLEEEKQAARVWELQAQNGAQAIPERLLQGEFLHPAEQAGRWQAALARIFFHAFEQVPYYRSLPVQPVNNGRGELDAASWLQLPLLRKQDLITHATDLRAEKLLGDQKPQVQSKTSGTTGQPVAVLHSDASKAMFAWLKQRELRWFRFDPSGTFLSIRPGEELARTADNSKWPDGKLLEMPGWPYLHKLFRTGPAFGFASTNPVQDQVAVLEQLKPDYLLMEPATLENLALQQISAAATEHLRAIQSISQTLTVEMEQLISSGLQAPIFQNYGLNEIGLVASMCPQGHRYHVHHEHCYVELLTESGELAEPGQRGKIVVTSLTNSAMPLLRYDTEDWAEMADGDCPCGRSLFSFTHVEGRYRRLAQLPEGSYQRFKAVQATVNHFARATQDKSIAIYQYQLCQHKDGDFTLTLDCSDGAVASLETAVQEAFAAAWQSEEQPALSIVRGKDFRGLEKRKFQIFYSEFMPD